MTSKLWEIRGKLLIGLQPSASKGNVAFWKLGANVVFRDLAVRPELGHYKVVDKLSGGEIRSILETVVAGKPNIFWGTLSSLFRYQFGDPGIAISVGSGYSGALEHQTLDAPATQWSLESWGNWVIAGHDNQDPLLWQDTGDFATLASLEASLPAGVTTWRPRFFIRLKIHMLAFAMDDVGNWGLYWCKMDDILDWDASVAGASAGDLPLRDLDSDPVGVFSLGAAVVFCTKTSLHIISYLGYPIWFSSIKSLDGAGLVGPKAATVVNRIIYGFGSQGIWKSDGYTLKYIDKPLFHSYIYNNFNQSQASKVVAVHDAAQERIIWFYPSKGSKELDRTIAYGYINGEISIPAFVRTAASGKNLLGGMLTGTKYGDLYLQGIDLVTAYGDSPLRVLELAPKTYILVGYVEGVTSPNKPDWGYGGWDESGFGGYWEGAG